MKRVPVIKVCAGVLLAAVALFVFAQVKNIDSSEHEAFQKSLGRLKQLDAVIHQDALKARFRLLNDYDVFFLHQREFTLGLQGLTEIPSFVDTEARAEMKSGIAELVNVWTRKASLLERFISENAVLNNSLRYFPLAGGELIKQVSGVSEDGELQRLCNELMREVLIYSLLHNNDEASEVQAGVQAARRWLAEHPQHSQAAFVGSLLSHANVILARKPRIDLLTRQLLTVPTGARIGDLARKYDFAFACALQQSNFHRAMLYGCCTILLGGILLAFNGLHQANRHLEGRVLERTEELSLKNEELEREIAERKQAQAELVQASRVAGMAEVATGVLHNVGNVLNSVNVSANLISEKLRRSKVSHFGKAADLLRAHNTDLARFLTDDTKGRELPGYFIHLAEQFTDEHRRLAAEVESLRSYVDHIKNIVAMQQRYAKMSGVTESFSLVELLEDTLRMHSAALERHGVEIVREFEPVPEMCADKHRVLQILINIIKNAKYACSEAPNPDKRIVLRVSGTGSHVRIAVSDNGIGIAAENLVRIFSHGFTTKKDGHGFGLHSSALAAQQMGGSLGVHSDGLGRGATFTLELPIRQTQERAVAA